jgi:hypothetical protein
MLFGLFTLAVPIGDAALYVIIGLFSPFLYSIAHGGGIPAIHHPSSLPTGSNLPEKITVDNGYCQ